MTEASRRLWDLDRSAQLVWQEDPAPNVYVEDLGWTADSRQFMVFEHEGYKDQSESPTAPRIRVLDVPGLTVRRLPASTPVPHSDQSGKRLSMDKEIQRHHLWLGRDDDVVEDRGEIYVLGRQVSVYRLPRVPGAPGATGTAGGVPSHP